METYSSNSHLEYVGRIPLGLHPGGRDLQIETQNDSQEGERKRKSKQRTSSSGRALH